MQSMAEQVIVEQSVEIAAEPAPALLAMRGICKSYGERQILDRIDLDVRPREKVAIIGPSGSGKTTILRTAIGLVKPYAGTIRIDGAYLWHEQTQDGLRPAGERHARKVRRAVDRLLLGRRITANDRAPEIAGVAFDHRADVENDHLAVLNDLLGRHALEHRGVRSGAAAAGAR